MPATRTHTPNAIAHFDIAGPDLAQLGHFYNSVFGWTIESRGPGYSSVQTPDGTPRGALVEADDPSLTMGIVVAHLGQALKLATAAGGAIVMPETDNGWVRKAQVTDPAGNLITVIQA